MPLEETRPATAISFPARSPAAAWVPCSRGRDVDLGRDLAVKVLLEKYVNRPEVARRFIEEAQIGGQFQHPGVVPVYDIGRFGDRPFFTMKLVKGQTLAAILGERTEPAADRPRLLGIAVQVAQAMAYAHAKGVIHRDLKPANIMVGAFGEVQVMDWGLAKVLAEGGVARRGTRQPGATRAGRERTIRTARSTGVTAASARTPKPARSWARRRTCRRSRPAATSPFSTAGPMSSAWARSCARS